MRNDQTMNFLFGGGSKQEDPAVVAKGWKKILLKEMRNLEKDIRNLGISDKRACDECKKLARSNNMGAARILAKEIVNTRKAVERLNIAKAQMNSVCMTLQTSISMIKLQGCLSKSTEIMSSMNKLVSIPEIRESMLGMAREMEKAGLVDELIADTFAMLEDPSLESEADSEVDKIVEEITSSVLASARAAPTRVIQNNIGAAGLQPAAVGAEGDNVKDEASDEEFRAMQARLGAL